MIYKCFSYRAYHRSTGGSIFIQSVPGYPSVPKGAAGNRAGKLEVGYVTAQPGNSGGR